MVCDFRISAYGGVPVHISAYIVDTEQGGPACCAGGQDWGEDSDSGISDTAQDSEDESNVEKDKNPEEEQEEAMDLECETIMFDSMVSPIETVEGLDSVLGLTPPPEDDLLDLGAELVHIDEQLMNIEDDLGHIDEAFIMMDQQLAESISEDVYDNTDYTSLGAEGVYDNTEYADHGGELDLDNLGVQEENQDIMGNPFDDWQRDALADIEELALDNVSGEVPHNVRALEKRLASEESLDEVTTSSSDILHDPDLFPTDDTSSGAAILEEFDDDLFGGSNAKQGVVVGRDVTLPQMGGETVSSQGLRLEREDSLDRELLQEVSMAQVEEQDEDLIMQVLRESDIDFEEIPLDSEQMVTADDVKVELVKEEDIKEEVIDVEDIGFELQLTDGASAKVEIDYDKLHADLKSNSEVEEDSSVAAEFVFDPGFEFDLAQDFNQAAFHHDHNYLGSTKEGPAILGQASAAALRRRNVSESSG